MVDLLHCEPDIYIRPLQLNMLIFWLVTVNSPASAFHENLFAEPPLYGELDDGGSLKRQENSDIEHPIFIYNVQHQSFSTTFAVKIKWPNKTIRSGKKIGGGDNESLSIKQVSAERLW